MDIELFYMIEKILSFKTELLKLQRKQCEPYYEDVSHLKNGLNMSFCV